MNTTNRDRASFASAFRLWEKDRLRAAFAAFEKLARRGDLSAQVNLATFYSDGLGRPRDYRLAKKWLLRAYRGGALHAASNLGLLFWSEGRVADAEKWIRLATKSGDGDAWLQLSRLYLFAFADSRRARLAASKVLTSNDVTPHSRDVASALLAVSRSNRRTEKLSRSRKKKLPRGRP